MRTFLKSGSSRVVARCAAICLLVLTALPFTAPFATCELSDTGLVMFVEDGGADSKDATHAHAVSLAVQLFDMLPMLLLELHGRVSRSFCTPQCSASLISPLRL